jgi:hypothetical protein
MQNHLNSIGPRTLRSLKLRLGVYGPNPAEDILPQDITSNKFYVQNFFRQPSTCCQRTLQGSTLPMVKEKPCKKTAYPFRATSLRICCYGRSIPCLTARIRKPTVRSPIKNLIYRKGGCKEYALLGKHSILRTQFLPDHKGRGGIA